MQLYYQNYAGLSPVLTMVRLLPMNVTGFLCNVVVALVVGRVDLVILIGTVPTLLCSSPPFSPPLLQGSGRRLPQSRTYSLR